jgi:hypothetical protein
MEESKNLIAYNQFKTGPRNSGAFVFSNGMAFAFIDYF